MNKILAVIITVALGATPLFADEAPTTPAAPASKAAAKPAAKKSVSAASAAAFKTEDERTFYAYGFKIGQNLAASTSPSEAEAKAISSGLRDAILGKSEPEGLSLAAYLPKVGEMVSKRVAAKAEAEKEKGKAYAKKFAKEDGVKAIPMGGYIKTLTEGSGATPTADDTVKVHYRGTLINGTEFDSSYARHEPATFPLKNVIPCWTNGVAMMKVGGKAKLVCPSEAAYGDQGHPPTIPGGSTLNFEVELLEIVKPEAANSPAPAQPVKKN